MLSIKLRNAGRAFKDVICGPVTAALASGGARGEQMRLQRVSMLLYQQSQNQQSVKHEEALKEQVEKVQPQRLC